MGIITNTYAEAIISKKINNNKRWLFEESNLSYKIDKGS
jgi:hypothetical protein